MDQILILDRDPDHARALATSLCRAGRSIGTCADERDALAKLLADDIDVLIVVPHRGFMWREQVRGIRMALNTRFNRPAVLCILRRAPEGAADRLFGDSLGIEVHYEY